MTSIKLQVTIEKENTTAGSGDTAAKSKEISETESRRNKCATRCD